MRMMRLSIRLSERGEQTDLNNQICGSDADMTSIDARLAHEKLSATLLIGLAVGATDE